MFSSLFISVCVGLTRLPLNTRRVKSTHKSSREIAFRRKWGWNFPHPGMSFWKFQNAALDSRFWKTYHCLGLVRTRQPSWQSDKNLLYSWVCKKAIEGGGIEIWARQVLHKGGQETWRSSSPERHWAILQFSIPDMPEGIKEKKMAGRHKLLTWTRLPCLYHMIYNLFSCLVSWYSLDRFHKEHLWHGTPRQSIKTM